MQLNSPLRISLGSCLALLLLMSSVGCQQRTVGKLQGRWEGRPDSAVTRAAREAEKYGNKHSDVTDQGSTTKTSEPPKVTDWEAYEVTVVMDFVSSEQIEMSLNGEQPQSGTWTIVSTSPTGCSIEVLTDSASAEEEDDKVERRRFELVFDEREGTCVGFQLTESGADPQLGALYFCRPKSSGDSSLE